MRDKRTNQEQGVTPPVHTDLPTKDECLARLGINDMDLAMLRAIQIRGVKQWCEDKLDILKDPVELEVIVNEVDFPDDDIDLLEEENNQQFSGDYKSFSSLVYNFFREEFKNKGTEWRKEDTPTELSTLSTLVDELKECKLKVKKIYIICTIVSRLYIHYRKVVSKEDEDV